MGRPNVWRGCVHYQLGYHSGSDGRCTILAGNLVYYNTMLTHKLLYPNNLSFILIYMHNVCRFDLRLFLGRQRGSLPVCRRSLGREASSFSQLGSPPHPGAWKEATYGPLCLSIHLLSSLSFDEVGPLGDTAGARFGGAGHQIVRGL